MYVISSAYGDKAEENQYEQVTPAFVGEPFGRYLYLGLGVAAALLSLWFVYTGKIEPLAFIWAPCVYLCLHVLTWRRMVAIRSGKKLNSILGETSRNMLFFGLLLSLAFIL